MAISRSRLGVLIIAAGMSLAVAIGLATWPTVGDDTQNSATKQVAKAHPLEPALERAREGVTYIKANVDDFTATIVKRERVGNELLEAQFMSAKIRNRKVKDGKVVVPFSVYLKFIGPESVKGREVIWVEGKNEGKLIAHETGFWSFKRFHLKPNSLLAMMGQRYPINKIGIQNLVEELVVKGQRDLKYGECEVDFIKGAKVDDRVCTLIQVVHPRKRDHFEFYRARIFIDDELQVPIRYAAWSWPLKPGGDPELIEEYTYRNLKLNVGMTDKDFDPDNADYEYP